MGFTLTLGDPTKKERSFFYLSVISDKKSLIAAWILNLLRQIIADSRDKEHLVVATICQIILLKEHSCLTVMKLRTTDQKTGDMKMVFFYPLLAKLDPNFRHGDEKAEAIPRNYDVRWPSYTSEKSFDTCKNLSKCRPYLGTAKSDNISRSVIVFFYLSIDWSRC